MAKKNFKPKSFEEKQKEIKDLTNSLHDRVNSYFQTPEQMKEYLSFNSRFYQYSRRNVALINLQFPGATAVGSFAFWKKSGFSVNKGEKGIKILKPTPFEYFKRDDSDLKIPINKATREEQEMIRNKEIITYKDMFFTVTHVFDVSQTNAKAKDLPDIFPNRWLEGQVEDYSLVRNALEQVAAANDIKIVEPYEELGVAKGVSYTDRKEVALNPRNSELQNVKTLIHELAHATLHTSETRDNYTYNEREFQAEMTAFTVCSYLGIDTSEYSLQYIHHYAKDESQFNDKLKLLDEVNKTSCGFIEIIEKEFVANRVIEVEKEKEEKKESGPLVSVEWSDVKGLEPNTTMSVKEMNDFLLDANKKLQTSDKDIFELSTKYKVVDTEGNSFSFSNFDMHKIEDEQIFPSLIQQIHVENPELYQKIAEQQNITSADLGFNKDNENTLKLLTSKYENYQNLLHEEKSCSLNEDITLNRLIAENDYFESKSKLIKTGKITEVEIQNLETKITSKKNPLSHQDHPQKSHQDTPKQINKKIVQELDR